MDRDLQRVPSISTRSFLSRTFSGRSATGDGLSGEQSKGPLGLNTLSPPLRKPAVADLVFVHGLAGGSQSTWTKSGEPSLYWPKKWLAADEAFQDVRIHSFGYDSNWDKESILGIHEFAHTLLGSLGDCPEIPRDSEAPIIFVGHSMGGLVIKRAYLLAKGKAESASLAARIKAIFFLATPHRGSDLAQTFSKVLTLSGGSRPFLTDLHRDSLEIRSINDEFPEHCQDLKLCSFYETLPTSFGVRKGLVVERDLATLGYANERREGLLANHRDICKYDSPDDPNYRTVRNALASFVGTLRDCVISTKQDINHERRRLLETFLGTSDAPEGDFMSADSLRMSGSGEWLIDKGSFQNWLSRDGSPIFCIIAKPATGKTVLSGKVIAQLRQQDKYCSFYFFRYGHAEKSNIASFLLSMAWQMALSDDKVMAVCLGIYEKNDRLSNADYRTIWRKLFVEGILKASFENTHYWVIDALDECKSEPDIVPLLLKAAEVTSVRIFLTSRNKFEPLQRLGSSKFGVHLENIPEESSKSDIALYLNANIGSLPALDENGRQHMVQQILEKSRGCFLWVSLVFQELRNVHTSSDVEEILNKVPADMDELYARILDSMSAASHGKPLTKAILTWTLCSSRPLGTSELHEALQLDLKDSTDSVEAAVQSCCGQLVYVDAKSQVQMIHLTARDFLLQAGSDSEFSVNAAEGHRRLLLTCLQYLSGDDMKVPKRGRFNANILPKEHSPFARYACDSLFEHILHVSWTDGAVLSGLAHFFRSSNVLSWIEYIARCSDQQRLIQTGNALKKFLQGSSGHTSQTPEDMELLNSWATDLVRLVMKFGSDLEAHPSSIFHLIPPFCPPTTAPYKQFGSAARNFTVRGLRAETWDECLSTIVRTHEKYSSLASSKTKFAIGCLSGKIFLFKQTTLQETGTLHHEEPVRHMELADEKEILVSAGSKSIRVWDVISKVQLQKFDARKQCMALTLIDQDEILLAAMQDHHLRIWEVDNGELSDNIDWTQGLGEMKSQLYRRPVTAAFSVETGLLAIIYKGHSILLLDLESDSLYDIYSRKSGASGNPETPYREAGVRCLVFGRGDNANLLAAAYVDGELVLFDTSTGGVRERLDELFAHILASSPDGSTLATADPEGTIQLFTFDTLQLLYRINPVEPGLQGLAFNGDGSRLLDIRGSQCRVWGPTVLVGQGRDEALRNDIAALTTPLEINIGPHEDIVPITSIACHDGCEVFFCGKEDGTVHLYSIESGVSSRVLFSHGKGTTILALHFEKESQTLSSVDTGSRIMVHRLAPEAQSMVATDVLFDNRADLAVHQLVCDKGPNHILVCTVASDMLWSISPNVKLLLNSTPSREHEACRWVKHPSNEGQLILMTRHEAHIYDWSNLERLTGPTGIKLEHNISKELSIRSITPCFNGTILATMFSESSRPLSKSKLVFWSTSRFTPESKSATPSPDFCAISDKIDFLIGTTGAFADPARYERLVFLHNKNWVCSADFETAKGNNFVRHFFFPTDWLTTDLDLKIDVTKKGDVILVKKDEVAVVRKGLLMSETMEEGGVASAPRTLGTKRTPLSRRNRKPQNVKPN